MLIFHQYEVDPHPIAVCTIAVGVSGLVLDIFLRRLGVLAMPWRR